MNDKLLFNNINDGNCLNSNQLKRLKELGLEVKREAGGDWEITKSLQTIDNAVEIQKPDTNKRIRLIQLEARRDEICEQIQKLEEDLKELKKRKIMLTKNIIDIENPNEN